MVLDKFVPRVNKDMHAHYSVHIRWLLYVMGTNSLTLVSTRIYNKIVEIRYVFGFGFERFVSGVEAI